MKSRIIISLIATVFFFGCAATHKQGATPTTVYLGGTILTMNDSQPEAGAVAVRDGRVFAVGTRDEVLTKAGQNVIISDLAGRTMLPGFVDSHGHGYMMGLQATTANLLPPPDGEGADIPSLVSILKQWADENRASVEKVGWIAGFGYDNSQLAEGRHPTRDDLDKVSSDIPVLILHQSGHLGVANSKALEVAGITAETKDPKGGVFGRRPGSREPNGVAEEYAFFRLVAALFSTFDKAANDALVEKGTELASSFGYTTVQEGRAMGEAIEAMRRVAEKGSLKVDLVAYPDILEVDAISPEQTYQNNFRIGGAKLTIDGSPQGKTAWLSQPYHIPPEGQKKSYAGYAAIDEKTVEDAVSKAFRNGWQILVHANGDAAIDSVIRAIRKARSDYPKVNNRPVLIHGQTLRRDQVADLKKYDIFPSLFPMHTYYWGDYHVESVLGPTRGMNISPTGWVLGEGLIFGTHHDAPVALPDSMRVLSATVTRRSRSGKVIGPEHRVPVRSALKAMTIWPAWQHFEEGSKGSIEVGKIADLVILSANPEEVPEEKIAEIKVLTTIKDGEVVYQRSEEVASTLSPASFGLTVPNPDVDSRKHPHFGGDGCFVGVEAIAKALAER